MGFEKLVSTKLRDARDLGRPHKVNGIPVMRTKDVEFQHGRRVAKWYDQLISDNPTMPGAWLMKDGTIALTYGAYKTAIERLKSREHKRLLQLRHMRAVRNLKTQIS